MTTTCEGSTSEVFQWLCIVYCSLDTYLHLQHWNIFKTVTWYGWIEVKSVRIAQKNWGNNYISAQHISDSKFHVFISPQQSAKWQKRIPTLTIHIVHTRTDFWNFILIWYRGASHGTICRVILETFSLHLFKRLQKLYCESLPYNVHEDVHDKPVIIDETSKPYSVCQSLLLLT